MSSPPASHRRLRSPDPGSRRRRAAVCVVFAVAALATAGTSASPVPPPALTGNAGGTIEVSPEHPIATVELSVTANAELRAKGSTEVRIAATAARPVPGPASPDPGSSIGSGVAVATIVSLDGTATPMTADSATLVDVVGSGCPASGDCTQHYRITLVLADPTAGTVSYAWSAEAGARFGPDSKGSAPPDARLAVTSEPPVIPDAPAWSAALVELQRIQIDAAHPRTTQTWAITRPPDGAAPGTAPVLVLRIPAVGGTDRYDQPGSVSLELDGKAIGSVQLSAFDQVRTISLPSGCTDAAGCRGSLVVRVDWTSRNSGSSATADWSLIGLSTTPADGPVVPFTFGGPTVTTLTTEGEHETATTRGTFDLEPGQRAVLRTTASIDVAGLPQSTTIVGSLQPTFTATATVAGPAPTDPVIGFTLRPRAATANAGVPVNVVGALQAVDCTGRSRCAVEIETDASVGTRPGSRVHVDWSMTVILLLDPSGPSLPDVGLTLGVTRVDITR